MLLYQRTADSLRESLGPDGNRGPGARLPGVRRLAHQYGVSNATMVRALQLLEDQGWIEARPRSGFFVRARSEQPALPASTPPPDPQAVTSQAIAMELIRASARGDLLQLGTAVPDGRFFPLTTVRRALARALRDGGDRALGYAFPPGLPALREVLAARLADGGCHASPDALLVTAGAQEAIQLALRSLTEPGDVVAVESPTYYGLLQAIESLGLKALEIPTDPQRGISVEALERALARWPLKALVLVPNASNPTGYQMAPADRAALVATCDAHGLPIIEDDVYADLTVEPGSNLRPRALKAHDTQDRHFLCGSASKTVAPGLRLGWLLAPRAQRERLEYLKYAGSLSASAPAQYALAELYGQLGIQRHLRRLRDDYAQRTARAAELVERAFPDGTRAARPAGGFVLWIAMPADIDAIALHRAALGEGIVIAPGPIFSAAGRYEHCLRLNVAVPDDADFERAVIRLGRLAAQLGTGRL